MFNIYMVRTIQSFKTTLDMPVLTWLLILLYGFDFLDFLTNSSRIKSQLSVLHFKSLKPFS